MNIVFYSTNSNIYDEAVKIEMIPRYKEQWRLLSEKNQEKTFCVATQKPGMFLIDEDEDFESQSQEQKKRVYELKSDSEEENADFIASLKPDLAIAASFYVTPFDWLSIKDSMTADFLRERGIPTICHPVDTAVTCFDKWRTHQILQKSGLNTAKAVYVHHELYINAGNRREIKSNVYKTSVLHEIKKLRFPVVVKDTVGLSSYGMDVLGNFSQVQDWLKSKKFTSDRIVEEFIKGKQFGLEIFAKKTESGRKITVLPPFIFSVNKYGITSPKQSVKAGPATSAFYDLEGLNKMMIELCELIDLNGFAQVDLVFDGKNWFVIEINPRLSGMTSTYAASLKMSIPEFMFCQAVENDKIESQIKKISPSLNIKFPLMDRKKREKAAALPFVAFVNQIENTHAKQEREKGYCEIILTGSSTENLKENLTELASIFSEECEKSFLEAAQKLLNEL